MPAAKARKCALGKFDLPHCRNAVLVRMSDPAIGMECSVIPAAGAEIAGLSLKLGARRREILYHAFAYSKTPPDGWEGRAPLLWPAVGRTNTPAQIARAAETGRPPRSFKYELNGLTLPMNMHGFARSMAWELTDHGVRAPGAFCTCALRSNPHTRKMYPFDFLLSVTHTLGCGCIVSTYTVTAERENSGPMPFAIGNHIGFSLPFGKHGSFDACTVCTPGNRQTLLTELGMLAGKTVKKNVSKPVPLSSGIWADTFLSGYTHRAAWAELADPESVTLRISQTERPVKGKLLSQEKDLHFVFWGSPGLGYFCPEPWLGSPNALNTGKGCIKLAPGQKFIWEMKVRVK